MKFTKVLFTLALGSLVSSTAMQAIIANITNNTDYRLRIYIHSTHHSGSILLDGKTSKNDLDISKDVLVAYNPRTHAFASNGIGETIKKMEIVSEGAAISTISGPGIGGQTSVYTNSNPLSGDYSYGWWDIYIDPQPRNNSSIPISGVKSYEKNVPDNATIYLTMESSHMAR